MSENMYCGLFCRGISYSYMGQNVIGRENFVDHKYFNIIIL